MRLIIRSGIMKPLKRRKPIIKIFALLLCLICLPWLLNETNMYYLDFINNYYYAYIVGKNPYGQNKYFSISLSWQGALLKQDRIELLLKLVF